MTGRRTPRGPNAPVGGNDVLLAPPEEEVLASTDPDEAPPPAGPWPGEEEVGQVVGEGPESEEITELSPEEQVTFASLLTCGRRSKVVHILDHTVVVQTLCGDDDLRIGLWVKQYQGSLGEQRAYQIGVAAAGIRSIDGVPLVQSLYELGQEDAIFDQKVAKVSGMYPTVINRVYRAVMDAEKEFVELATKLGKLDG